MITMTRPSLERLRREVALARAMRRWITATTLLALVLVGSIWVLGGTISRLEQKLEDKVDTHARRFDRFVLSQESRLTAVETRCAIEHGEMPDSRSTTQRVVNWQERSDVSNAGTKAPQ